MRKVEVTAFELAERFIGTKEVRGSVSNPMILAMLRLDESWPQDDEVPWCSAFMNYICWLLRLPRSKSLLARSWLEIGRNISLDLATTGFDVVILKRGIGIQPGPEIIKAPGHVGFFSGFEPESRIVEVLGGNQSDSVGVQRFPAERILGIRRIFE